jgi:hypothetical protein
MLDVHEQVSRSPRPKHALEMSVARLLAIRPAHSIDDLVSKITKMQGGGSPRKPKSSSTSADDDGTSHAPAASGFLQPSGASGKSDKPTPRPSTARASGFLNASATPVPETRQKRSQRPTIRPGNGIVAQEQSTPAPAQPKTPEIVAPPSPEEQFLGFVRAVKEQTDLAYDVIDHLAFHAIEGSRVSFVTPHKFHLSRISNLRKDAYWQDSLERFFKVRNFSVRVRRDGESFETPTERQDRLNAAQTERLKEAFMQEQTYEILTEIFDAKITKIHLETPIPKGH